MIRRLFALAPLLLGLVAAPAIARCQIPKPVRTYLKAHPTWSVVDDSDLNANDKLSWRRTHRGMCPGLAAVGFNGARDKSYGLAVTNQARGGRNERLILLEPDGKKLTAKTLVQPFQVGDPLVVWRGRARTVREFGSRKPVAIAHESIVFEKMGMSSKVFYLDGGKIRTVLVAN